MEVDKYNYSEFPYIYEQYLGGNFEQLLRKIAEVKAKHIQKAIDTAISDCFDLKTAKGNALDMWGRLLNLSRYIPFDLENPGGDYQGDYRTLTDDEFRIIIVWAYQSQNFDINITELQKWLNGYFNMNAAVQDINAVNVSDFQNMSEKVLYSSGIDEYLRWVLTEYDLIPRPAGVKDSLVPIVNKIFAFNSNAYSDKRTQFYFGRFANETDPQPPTTPYTQLAFLGMSDSVGATNLPYIDTGLKLNSNLKIEVKGYLHEGQLGSFVTAYINSNNRFTQIIYNASNKRIQYAYKVNSYGVGLQTLSTEGIDLANEFTLTQDNQSISIAQNGVVNTASYSGLQNETTSENVYLFRYKAQTAGNTGGIFMGYCKIWENGVLVREFIPVRRNSDSALGFLDNLNDIFYENQGALPFEIGS